MNQILNQNSEKKQLGKYFQTKLVVGNVEQFNLIKINTLRLTRKLIDDK